MPPDVFQGLVQPTEEVARVIGAVAKGDLSQRISLENEGSPLKGEFLRIGKTVNAIAVEAGLPQPVLHRFVRGERDLTLTTVQKLADYFGLELRHKM